MDFSKKNELLGTLCLSMREGDVITIGKDIVLQYTKQMSAKQIKVIIRAPKELEIDRVKTKPVYGFEQT